MSVDERSRAQNHITDFVRKNYPSEEVVSSCIPLKPSVKPGVTNIETATISSTANNNGGAASSATNSDTTDNNNNNNNALDNNNATNPNIINSKEKSRRKGVSTMSDFIKACEVDLVIDDSSENLAQEPATKKSLQEEFDFYAQHVLNSINLNVFYYLKRFSNMNLTK
jgi:hypothetical protein